MSPRLFVVVLVAAPTAQQPGNPPQTSQSTQQEQEQPRPPRFRVEANYVRVDVYPTRNGTPVPDLRKDDFEILEDGSRQSIEVLRRMLLRAVKVRAERHSFCGVTPMGGNGTVLFDGGHDIGGTIRLWTPGAGLWA